MSDAQYSIGIDLGTTNSLLAYVELGAGRASTKLLEVEQLDGRGNRISSESLPSVLYRPLESEREWLDEEERKDGWLVGRIALERLMMTPDRVAHSAKSWLGAHAVDCDRPFLPFGSHKLPTAERVSPVDASGMVLKRLRLAWDRQFPQSPLVNQRVTVTTPASFDPVAQEWTREAARRAGLPASVRLLEEPQAAFYRYLERRDGREALAGLSNAQNGGGLRVLVVDIGGGTSDFSVFEVDVRQDRSMPRTRRVAVSDHFLLGGDNLDLAVAKTLESRLSTDEALSAEQWGALVANARRVKESALDSTEASDVPLRVSLAGRGSGLMANAVTGAIDPETVRDLILTGFFAPCDAQATPREDATGLKEWGLPYATDPGLLRRLAHFLRERYPVDAVLFNGGTLTAASLRDRIRRSIEEWQEGAPVVELSVGAFGEAVARGAARYGRVSQLKTGRIESRAARGVYLELERRDGQCGALCVLPRGQPEEEEAVVECDELKLRVNQDVVFRGFTSSRRDRDKVGAVVPFDEDSFEALAPLSTRIDYADGDGHPVSVVLLSRFNALGRLRIECQLSADPSTRWPVEMSLRGADASSRESEGVLPPANDGELSSFKAVLDSFFTTPADRRNKKTLNALFKAIEGRLGRPKQDWEVQLIRRAWPYLWERLESRQRSIELEEVWLGFAGFLLRPGFGAAGDRARIEQLVELFDLGLAHPGKRIRLQWFTLWKRLAGGLDETWQKRLFDEAFETCTGSGKLNAEAVLALGALERVDAERKAELSRFLAERALAALDSGSAATAYLAALEGVLSRTPLFAGPDKVVAPDLVVEAFERLSSVSWGGADEQRVCQVFLRAARRTGERAIDLGERSQKQILKKLRSHHVAPTKLVPLQQVTRIAESERVSWLGDALPVGLTLE